MQPSSARARSQAPIKSPALAAPPAAQLASLNQQIVACTQCTRLREYCAHIAQVRRRAYANEVYWGRPVPSFGDPQARVLALGLAPGAHGSNRTGRPFTGDGSGKFLYPVLYDAGFASQPQAFSRQDGMQLHGLWISSVARCAPPGNKPSPQELRNCAPFLDEEMAALANLRVVVCLGKIAFDGCVAHWVRAGRLPHRKNFVFRHGTEYEAGGMFLLATYHPSLQNTNTGLLTANMLLRIFLRARELAGL